MEIFSHILLVCEANFFKTDCCSDDGFKKPTLIPYQPTGVLQVPSNVTRISRALRRVGLDGIPQIIFYHSGVGTGSTKIDMLTGGLLGIGISEVSIPRWKLDSSDLEEEYPRSLLFRCCQLHAWR